MRNREFVEIHFVYGIEGRRLNYIYGVLAELRAQSSPAFDQTQDLIMNSLVRGFLDIKNMKFLLIKLVCCAPINSMGTAYNFGPITIGSSCIFCVLLFLNIFISFCKFINYLIFYTYLWCIF